MRQFLPDIERSNGKIERSSFQVQNGKIGDMIEEIPSLLSADLENCFEDLQSEALSLLPSPTRLAWVRYNQSPPPMLSAITVEYYPIFFASVSKRHSNICTGR